MTICQVQDQDENTGV